MPANLTIEVRVALLRDGGKSLRHVARTNKLSIVTMHDVLAGNCGLKKNTPSVRAIQVLRALTPWLPSNFAAELQAEFPQFFASPKKQTARKGTR